MSPRPPVRDVQIDSELRALRADIGRLKERLEGIENSQLQLHQQLAEMREATGVVSESQSARVDRLSQEVDGMSRKLAAERDELYADLSQKIAEVVAKLRPPTPAPRVATGYEHEVRPGETLSEIAKAYGVTIKAITDANKLKSSHVIRVGQKLFIPDA